MTTRKNLGSISSNHENYLKQLHESVGEWTIDGGPIEPAFFCDGLSRLLDEKYGVKEAKQKAKKVVEWFDNWQKPLTDEVIGRTLTTLFSVLLAEMSWSCLLPLVEEQRGFKDSSNPEWWHYQDLQKALESAVSEKEKKRVRTLINAYLQDIGREKYKIYEIYETLYVKTLGIIGKTKLTRPSKLLLKYLVQELGEYCENARYRAADDEERNSNDRLAAKKLRTLASYFGLDLPAHLRRLETDLIPMKKPVLRRIK